MPPVTRTADDPGTSWLLHADDDALAITPRASAPALWQRITRVGRPWQICAVGHEALLRYRMLTRLAVRTAEAEVGAVSADDGGGGGARGLVHELVGLLALERELAELPYVRRADALERVADTVRRLGELGAR